MSKYLPPKPKLHLDIKHITNEGHACWDSTHVMKEFDMWYDREIVPLFENAVKVFCNKKYGGACSDQEWGAAETLYTPDATHTALIINIKPIKEETAEDHLRRLIEIYDAAIVISSDPFVFGMNPQQKIADICKAKAFLEKKK